MKTTVDNNDIPKTLCSCFLITAVSRLDDCNALCVNSQVRVILFYINLGSVANNANRMGMNLSGFFESFRRARRALHNPPRVHILEAYGDMFSYE